MPNKLCEKNCVQTKKMYIQLLEFYHAEEYPRDTGYWWRSWGFLYQEAVLVEVRPRVQCPGCTRFEIYVVGLYSSRRESGFRFRQVHLRKVAMLTRAAGQP